MLQLPELPVGYGNLRDLIAGKVKSDERQVSQLCNHTEYISTTAAKQCTAPKSHRLIYLITPIKTAKQIFLFDSSNSTSNMCQICY